MGTEDDKKYMEFREKVKRTVYMDNLSPKVTEAVLKSAFNQFGDVMNVQFIPNYTENRNIPQCALVEMENAAHAQAIIVDITNFPFMISGMPRPVRAFPAEEEMFIDRPRKPGRKIQCQWIDPSHSKAFEALTRKLNVESSLLLELQLEEEEKLAKQQEEVLEANYRKFSMMNRVMTDGTLGRLASRLQFKINDD